MSVELEAHYEYAEKLLAENQRLRSELDAVKKTIQRQKRKFSKTESEKHVRQLLKDLDCLQKKYENDMNWAHGQIAQFRSNYELLRDENEKLRKGRLAMLRIVRPLALPNRFGVCRP